MGITRLHNFEHRNKAYFKVFKVKYVKYLCWGNPMNRCSFVLLIEIQKLLSHNCSEHD